MAYSSQGEAGMRQKLFVLIVGLLVLVSEGAPAQASEIWGNSASSGNVNLEAFDSVTGTLIPGQQFLVPNLRRELTMGVASLFSATPSITRRLNQETSI
jgi:hypothetical protein